MFLRWMAIASILWTMSGCHSVIKHPGPNLTANNFRVLKAHATSRQYGFKLLGLIPLAVPDRAEAEAEIYRSVGQSVEGRPVTLANQIEERTGLYFILFSVPKLTMTADVIEFTERDKSMN